MAHFANTDVGKETNCTTDIEAKWTCNELWVTQIYSEKYDILDYMDRCITIITLKSNQTQSSRILQDPH